MQQYNMFYEQTLNKFHIVVKNIENIWFIHSICYQQPSNDFNIPYLFYTNKPM